MKRVLAYGVVGAILLIAGFAGGRWYQDLKSGYHLRVLEEKQYGDPKDPVRWRCVLETIGLGFLNSETYVIEYRGRTIYKCQRDFQERVPVAANIKVSGKQIDWDDGDLKFHLTVAEIKKDQKGAATNQDSAGGVPTAEPAAK